jgi:type II secretory pathway component GspD/PulD (secretin)
MIRRLVIALVFVTITTLAVEPGKKFETYSILTPDSDAMVSMAQAIGGSESRVLFDKASNKLLVYAAPDVHASIKKLLEQINVMPQNIMLEVIVHEAGRAVSSSASLGLKGEAVISSSGTSGKITAKPSVSAHSGRKDVMTSQKLLLQSGSAAIITVGKEVPFLSYLLVLGRNWGYIQPEVEIRKVGASLRAKATIIGNSDLLSVTLTPELSGLVGDKITRIRYTKVATTVTIKSGDTVTIGSFGNHSSFYKKFLAGYSGGDESKGVNITLTADIMEPTGRLK